MNETARNSPYPFLPTLSREKRGGMVQHIQDAIRDAIIKLELAPGTFIDKGGLCMQFGVSRFPVSEALGRLADEGFVEVLPQRGTRVTLIDLFACREAMFIRRALETSAIRLVSQNADTDFLATLEQNLKEQKSAMAQGNRIRFYELDVAMHDLLLDELGFERVKTSVFSARGQLDRLRVFMNTPARMASTYREHKDIVEAIFRRNAEDATRAMEAHLDLVMTEIASFHAAHPEVFQATSADKATAPLAATT